MPDTTNAHNHVTCHHVFILPPLLVTVTTPFSFVRVQNLFVLHLLLLFGFISLLSIYTYPFFFTLSLSFFFIYIISLYISLVCII